ncbi:Wadjet anti-phage system protein JetD domain-containing protein [Luteococcus sp.]|uniref:Wadjet anti-phage system protein JetD domain-containing protein n=1 Tax=Luteococcus sp. TaxID=1969402 RepID=UPI0037354827
MSSLLDDWPHQQSLTIEQLSGLRRPERVVVVENLASLARVPLTPGTLAIHGRGFAVSRLEGIAWLDQIAKVLYWGDLDTHGFAILSKFRECVPQTESVLRSRGVLEQFSSQCVQEKTAYRGCIAGLTASETDCLMVLRERGLRLEQERIDPQYASSTLTRLLD